MAQAYIVGAVRSAGGRRGGRLSGWHPVDLGAHVVDALLRRTGVDPSLVDDVILGCVSQAGEQSTNLARNVVLASGMLPQTVPGTTVDRQCGSSQQAIHFAAQAVMSGWMDVVVAGGVESMSRVPMGLPHSLPEREGLGSYVSPAIQRRYGVRQFSQFEGAEMIAQRYGFTREQLDAYALLSHQRAAAAADAGVFDAEIEPLPARTADGGGEGLHDRDEGVRADTSAQALAGLRVLREGGVITAGNASQICDGASAVLVASEQGLRAIGAMPLARIHHMSVMGGDPVVMLLAPLEATRRALQRSGLSLDGIDLYEVNEAFASVPLAWGRELDADPQRLNVHGGAIALGHPLGASGARLMTTLVHALHRRGARYGLQTMCEGGGMANVTIVERM